MLSATLPTACLKFGRSHAITHPNTHISHSSTVLQSGSPIYHLPDLRNTQRRSWKTSAVCLSILGDLLLYAPGGGSSEAGSDENYNSGSGRYYIADRRPIHFPSPSTLSISTECFRTSMRYSIRGNRSARFCNLPQA